MSERIRKINSLINYEMSQLIAQSVDFKPGVFVTISKVDTSNDLRYTRISVRVFPQAEIDYGMKTLEHERTALQKILHKKLHLKILPKISFKHDATGDEVDNLERLLAQ
jgi:ribosome-binding factor A